MFIAVLFILAPKWKQLRYSSMNEWLNKPWHIHTMGILFSNKNEQTVDTGNYNIYTQYIHQL